MQVVIVVGSAEPGGGDVVDLVGWGAADALWSGPLACVVVAGEDAIAGGVAPAWRAWLAAP